MSRLLVSMAARGVVWLLVFIPTFLVVSEPITFRFTGTVNTVAAILGDEVKFGDPVTVDVHFDPDTAPVFAGLPWYPVLSSSFTIHAAGGDLIASVADHPTERIVINDRQGAFQSDQWLWGSGAPDGFGGVLEQFNGFSIGEFDLLDYNIHLTDNTATAFSSGALPSSLDLDALAQRQGFAQFGMAGHDVRFSVDALEILGAGETGGGDAGGSDTAPAAPAIDEYSLNPDGSFTMTFATVPGVTYQARWSTDFENWIESETVVADSESSTIVVPPAPSTVQQRFFSVQALD